MFYKLCHHAIIQSQVIVKKRDNLMQFHPSANMKCKENAIMSTQYGSWMLESLHIVNPSVGIIVHKCLKGINNGW